MFDFAAATVPIIRVSRSGQVVVIEVTVQGCNTVWDMATTKIIAPIKMEHDKVEVIKNSYDKKVLIIDNAITTE